MKKYIVNYLIIFGVISIIGCEQDFLDIKPSTSILQPTTLDEFQGLLDNTSVINTTNALGTLSADEYVYSSYATWQSARTATERNAYVWAKDFFSGEVSANDWTLAYTAIFYANNVLNGIEEIKVDNKNSSRKDNLKGWALYVRASAYYDLVKDFSPTYDASTASNDLGVPLRLNPSIDQILPRSSVQETYNRILADLTQATRLLDAGLPIANRNRPSKVAAHAFAARMFLNMRKYDLAEAHADSCLQLYNKLINYNSINLNATTPFTTTNDESIYFSNASNKYQAYAITVNTYTQISPELISLYQTNDLRPSVYFKIQADGSFDMKRGMTGIGAYPFVGLATDEIYLIKAECSARRDDLSTALRYLNNLLINRYKTNTFQPVVASSKTDAIAKIILERRKELVWRNIRWQDIKRLNKEGANITLSRPLNGETFKIEPNSNRYVFPIPDNEINLSGIQQNIR